jgi:hypothetical protein
MHYARTLRYGSTDLPNKAPQVARGAPFTVDELRSLMTYDPLTGVLTWIPQPKRRHGKQWPTGVAGSKTAQGYLSVCINRRHYPAHRICWLHYYGKWPEQFIDHINGERTDNRISNLRDVSAKVNNENRHRPRRNTRSGILGVNAYPNGKFTASLKYDGIQHHLGTFDSAEEARAVYLTEKAKHHKGAAFRG